MDRPGFFFEDEGARVRRCRCHGESSISAGWTRSSICSAASPAQASESCSHRFRMNVTASNVFFPSSMQYLLGRLELHQAAIAHRRLIHSAFLGALWGHKGRGTREKPGKNGKRASGGVKRGVRRDAGWKRRRLAVVARECHRCGCDVHLRAALGQRPALPHGTFHEAGRVTATDLCSVPAGFSPSCCYFRHSGTGRPAFSGPRTCSTR